MLYHAMLININANRQTLHRTDNSDIENPGMKLFANVVELNAANVMRRE
jgi:hypothetical protein